MVLIGCIIIADIFILLAGYLEHNFDLKRIPFGAIGFGCVIFVASSVLDVTFPEPLSIGPYQIWGYCNGKGPFKMWSNDRCPNGLYAESGYLMWQEHILAKYPLYSLFLTILPYELPLIAVALIYYLWTHRQVAIVDV